jgi:polysaccharide biosynthesis protein PslH
MAGRIQEILSAEKHDFIIASQLGTACYRNYFNDLPALFEEVELGGFYESYRSATSRWRRFRNGLTWAKHRRYVAQLVKKYHGCTVVSEQERELLAQLLPNYDSIEVIDNFINLADYVNIVAKPQPNHLIFTGSFRYFANHDAMVWFLQEVYPRIQERVPEVHLTITGDHADLPLPPASGVTLTGVVDDVKPLIASSWVNLVPVRVGGGTRMKILEAMALGVPVVSTSKGAEGLELRDGEHILIGDTGEEFSANVLCLMKDPELRQRLVQQARKLAKEKYAWGVVIPRFDSLVQRLGNS